MTTENNTTAPPAPTATVEDRFFELHKSLTAKNVGNPSIAAAILTATEALCGELAEVCNRIHMVEEALLGTTPVEMVDDQGSVVPTYTSDVRSFEPDLCSRLDRIAYALEESNRQRSQRPSTPQPCARRTHPRKGDR